MNRVKDIVTMTDDALDNYGEQWRDVQLRITHRETNNVNLCKHGTEPIYRCPDNADHDEESLSDKPGTCSVCGVELGEI